MSIDDAQLRLEDCRLEVLAALYNRRTGAHDSFALRTIYLTRNTYTPTEIDTALADLERLGLVEKLYQGIAATLPAWKITAEGLRYKERPKQ